MFDSNPIDLPKLKALIACGIEAIPIDKENKQAVIVIGDTGVGKSTILSYLLGSQLIVRYDGLKPTLDNVGQDRIKIGHEKYSETSIPTKVVIQGIAFYDCPGFKDNKGEEYEISNSFFVQRLLDMYQKVKIVLIVDESHISEARADKLPKLVRNLLQAFGTFDDIQGGVVLIINRAGRDHSVEDYHKEIRKMVDLKNENGYLFNGEQRKFLDFLIQNRRVVLFKQASKQQKDRTFQLANKDSIMGTIKQSDFVKSKHIRNILSQSAKISIRDFIDDITTRSNYKIEIICGQIIQIYSQRVQQLGRDVNAIIGLKDQVVKLAEQIHGARKQSIIDILQRQLPRDKLQDFQQDFASVMFFKGIYDKTSTYFSNLVNKIYSELSHLLTKLDKRITLIQRENQEEVQRQREIKEMKLREKKREEEKVIAMEHCSKMEDLKVIAQTLHSTKKSLIDQIRSAMKCLSSVEDELRKVKQDTMSLKNMSKDIDNEFQRIETTYFTKKTVR